MRPLSETKAILQHFVKNFATISFLKNKFEFVSHVQVSTYVSGSASFDTLKFSKNAKQIKVAKTHGHSKERIFEH